MYEYINQQVIMLLPFNGRGLLHKYIKQHLIILLTFNRKGLIYKYIKQKFRHSFSKTLDIKESSMHAQLCCELIHSQ